MPFWIVRTCTMPSVSEHTVPVLPLRMAVLSLIYVVLIAGCDPVRKTVQPVSMDVLDATSRQPVGGADVQLRYDYSHSTSGKGDTYPRYEGVTDRQGHVCVTVEWVVLDRTIGPWPPAWRDWVTDAPYIVLIRKEDAVEELRVTMHRGASVQGPRFVIVVTTIDKPKYVRMD